MPIVLPTLPYPSQALEPYLGKATLELHHGRHHRAYIEQTNALVADTMLADSSLQEIATQAADQAENTPLSDNAAQAWNHGFYWKSMSPRGGGVPDGLLGDRITADFKSFAAFHRAFRSAAVNHFGSGWAWLVLDGSRLAIMTTSDAYCPLSDGKVPLLAMDLWEHAYYLDYRDQRPDYIENYLTKLANWKFAESNLRLANMRRAAE